MAQMYEFHVTGLIGPVVEAALPELTHRATPKQSVLRGTARAPHEVEQLLNRLGDLGLVADHIVIARDTRWRCAGRAADDPID